MKPFFPREFIARRAAEHGIRLDQLLSDDRHIDIVLARRDIASELRIRGMTYPQIGALLNRHHSSVMQMVRRAA